MRHYSVSRSGRYEGFLPDKIGYCLLCSHRIHGVNFIFYSLSSFCGMLSLSITSFHHDLPKLQSHGGLFDSRSPLFIDDSMATKTILAPLCSLLSLSFS